jgi:plastocyanin
VKLRMDFRDPNIVGTFLYHCHILKHEDMGMMGSIQVLPTGTSPKMKINPERQRVRPGDPIVVVASFGEANAGGTVQFLVDGREIAKPIPISNGQASFTTSFGEPGKHKFSAVYFGDAIFDEAMATSVEVQVRE